MNGWATGSNNNFNSSVFITNDGGKTWDCLPLETADESLHKIQFINNKIGWIVGENGIILKSTDGGNSWLEQNSGHESNDLYSCFFLDSDRGFIVGANGTILYTSDSGKHWIKQVNRTEKKFTSVFFTDDFNGWIVGDDGICYSTQNGGVTFIENEYKNYDGFDLFQNYPNPFNPSTTISCQIPKPTYLTIKIFDSSGGELATIAKGEKSAGIHKFNYSNTNLPSGVYYYQLVTETYKETKKMVILR